MIIIKITCHNHFWGLINFLIRAPNKSNTGAYLFIYQKQWTWIIEF